jgi:hypothetical protein
MPKLSLLLVAAILATLGTLGVLAQEDVATFRVAHFSVDAGSVDVYVEGELLLEAVPFGTVSEWMSVAPGTYAVAITPTGNTIDEAVLSETLTLEAGETFYTVTAIGFAVRPDISPLVLQVIPEDYSNIGTAETRVTFFHAIPTLAPVSVTVGDITLVEGLSYPTGTDAETDGLYSADVVAGTYDIQVTLTGDASTILFDLPATELTANRNYFIAATALEDDPELVLVSTNPDGLSAETSMDEETADSPANVRVAHFAEDAPPVDIFVNGEAILQNVEYPALSDFLQLEAGTYTVDIAPAGEGQEATVISAEITLAAGESYTAAAVGLLARAGTDDVSSLKLTLADENYSPLSATEARITIFHVSPGSSPVDVVVNGEVFAASLAYPGFLGENDGMVDFDVVAGNYDIQITAAGDPDTVLIDLSGTQLVAGNQYYVAAINTPDNISFFLTSETR